MTCTKMYKRQLRGDVENILNVQLCSFSFVNMKPNLRSHQISPLCSQSSPVFLYCNCNHANCWKPATLNLKSRVRSTSFSCYIPVREVSVQFLRRLVEDFLCHENQLTEYGCSGVTQQGATRYHRAQKRTEKEFVGARWNEAFFCIMCLTCKVSMRHPFYFQP